MWILPSTFHPRVCVNPVYSSDGNDFWTWKWNVFVVIGIGWPALQKYRCASPAQVPPFRTSRHSAQVYHIWGLSGRFPAMWYEKSRHWWLDFFQTALVCFDKASHIVLMVNWLKVYVALYYGGLLRWSFKSRNVWAGKNVPFGVGGIDRPGFE